MKEFYVDKKGNKRRVRLKVGDFFIATIGEKSVLYQIKLDEKPVYDSMYEKTQQYYRVICVSCGGLVGTSRDLQGLKCVFKNMDITAMIPKKELFSLLFETYGLKQPLLQDSIKFNKG